MNQGGSSLFDLLPALYRLKDAQFAQAQTLLSPAELAQLQSLQALPPPLSAVQQQQLDELTAQAARGPLQSLLMVVAEQLAVLADNLDQLYDDQFIETCAPWVIPYIGDLIGYQSVHGVAPAVASPRAEVGNTISLRQRKGTILVIEQLARDVTGWGAHAVEFFQLLPVTQYMNHIRVNDDQSPDLRNWKNGLYMNTGFDTTSHTVDVRRIAIERGRYNIQNIGVFLWTLNAYSLTNSPATAVAGSPQCYRFSPLGQDMPLFNNPLSQGQNITAAAEPINVPDRLRRYVLCQDIKGVGKGVVPGYYGVGLSLVLYLGNSPIPAGSIQVCNLSGADGSWTNVPPSTSKFVAAIDPELGRIALATAPTTSAPLAVSFYYGFNADTGGGEYPRAATFTASPEQVVVRVGATDLISTALGTLPGDGVVEVTTSGVYHEPGGLKIPVRTSGHIELRAADGCRPTLVLGAEISVTGGQDATFDLNGFVVTYAPPTPAAGSPAPALPAALVHAPSTTGNQLAQLTLAHCTLVPGWSLSSQGAPQQTGQPTLLAETPGLQVVLLNSIVGGLQVSGEATASLTDTIVDATDPTQVALVGGFDPKTNAPLPSGALTMVGCTIVGKVYGSLFTLVSDSLFQAALSAADLAASPPLWRAAVWSARKQQGCVRFSYLPAGSITPRQFQCVVQATGTPEPRFYSLRFGDPAYGKLLPITDDTIRRGADDGGEMGVFHFVLAPLRETDLQVRVQEYMPVGLEFGIFHET
jgi:hypothetical protein